MITKKIITVLLITLSISAYSQVQIISAGSGTAYTLAFPGVFTYSNGIAVTFKAHTVNTGTATINVNSKGAKNIYKQSNVPLAAGDIKAGQMLTLMYDGTNFQMTTPAGSNTFTDITVTNLNATTANVSGTGTIGNVLGTTGNIGTLTGTTSTYTNVNGTTGNIATLSGNTSTYVNVNGTNGNIATISGTTSTYTNVNGTTGNITNISGTTSTYTNVNGTNGNISKITNQLLNTDSIRLKGVPIQTVIANTPNNMSWNKTGNSISSGDFLGTTNNQPIVIRTNNTRRATVFANGTILYGDSLAGIGAKWFFDPAKGAFRAGAISTAKGSPVWWDPDSVGNGSFAAGLNTKAIGVASVALGEGGNANGYASTVIGSGGLADAQKSVAIGSGHASANEAISIGTRTNALSYREVVVGSCNASYTPISTNAWDSLDRIFVVGNGMSPGILSNAMVILKSGRVGIGTNTPTYKLDVSEDIRVNGHQIGRGKGNIQSNLVIGYLNMIVNTGSNNTAIGYASMLVNESGSRNTSLGSLSASKLTTGYDNVAIGYKALANNNTNAFNVAIGLEALGENASGSALTSNVAIGFRAGGKVTTGYGNVLVGEETGRNISTGYDNTWVGKQIGNSGTLTWINTTALGHATPINANNQLNLGNTAITQIRAQVTGITAYSDERYKVDVKDDVKGLEFITKLKPVTYYQRPKELHKIWGTPQAMVDAIDHTEIEAKRAIGFIAQQVDTAAREAGFEFPGLHFPQNEKDVYALNYTEFIMPLVKAVQELNAKIEALEKQNIRLRENVAILSETNGVSGIANAKAKGPILRRQRNTMSATVSSAAALGKSDAGSSMEVWLSDPTSVN